MCVCVYAYVLVKRGFQVYVRFGVYDEVISSAGMRRTRVRLVRSAMVVVYTNDVKF